MQNPSKKLLDQVRDAIQTWTTWHWVRTGLSLALAAPRQSRRYAEGRLSPTRTKQVIAALIFARWGLLLTRIVQIRS